MKISECSGCIKTSGASASFNNYQPTQLCHGSKPWPLVRFSANVAEPVTKALAKPQSFIPILWGWDKVVLLYYYIERWENIRNIQFHRCNFSFFQQTAWISIRLSWIFQETAQERLTFCLHCGFRLSWRRPRLQHRYGEAFGEKSTTFPNSRQFFSNVWIDSIDSHQCTCRSDPHASNTHIGLHTKVYYQPFGQTKVPTLWKKMLQESFWANPSRFQHDFDEISSSKHFW